EAVCGHGVAEPADDVVDRAAEHRAAVRLDDRHNSIIRRLGRCANDDVARLLDMPAGDDAVERMVDRWSTSHGLERLTGQALGSEPDRAERANPRAKYRSVSCSASTLGSASAVLP